MKRVLIFLLTLILVAGCFSACNNGKGPGDGAKQVTTSPADAEAPLPVADYTGKTFTVLSRNQESYKEEWIADGSTTETIGRAVFARNSAVEERYNVYLDFESGLVDTNDTLASNFIGKVDKMILAGENTYQLAAGYSYVLSVVSTRGNYLDWYTMPNVKLDRDWWDGEFLDYASYKGCSYIASGPLSLSAMKGSACLYFDMDAVEADIPGGVAQLFGEVRDGTWTIDRLMAYAKDCSSNVEGDASSRVYGFATNRNANIDAFVYAFDMGFTAYDEYGTPKIRSINASNPIVDAYEKMKNFIATDFCWYVDTGDPEYSDNGADWLIAHKTVFTAGILQNAATLRTGNVDINYGILPYPKWDADQSDYLTYKTHSHTDFAIPRTVRDAGEDEFVGTIVEALAYYSNLYVKDALYNVVLKYRDARDADSSYCVDLILGGGRYDFANIYAYAWGDQQGPAHLFRQALKYNTSSIVSAYKAEKERYDKVLDDFLKSFYIG